MKYLIVNPYGPTYGVTTYSLCVVNLLSSRIPVDYVGNEAGMSFEEFRHEVAEHVLRNYAPDDVMIEAPEARAAPFNVPDEYRLHVRLHAAGAIGQLGNGWPVDPDRLETELRLIRRAAVVSSSSYALLAQVSDLIDTSCIHVFKNPADRSIRFGAPDQKDIDVFFMGRLERLKGSDWLHPLMERLPEAYRSVLVGPGVEAFAVPQAARCSIDTGPAIYDRSRLDLLARSHVFLMLSRFENCSLAILEALASGTVVVGWDVGGNAEIAPPSLIRLVPMGDLDALTETVLGVCQSEYPSEAEFRDATGALTSDFEEGWSRVWDQLMNGDAGEAPYLGLSHRRTHVRADPRLAGGPGLVPLKRGYAEARASSRT